MSPGFCTLLRCFGPMIAWFTHPPWIPRPEHEHDDRWKIHPEKTYFLLKMGIVQRHVSFQGCKMGVLGGSPPKKTQDDNIISLGSGV